MALFLRPMETVVISAVLLYSFCPLVKTIDSPDPPTNLTVDATNTALKLSWTAPSGEVSSFNATLKRGDYEKTLDDNDTTMTFNDLIKGRMYTFSVKTQRGELWSKALTEDVYTTPGSPTNINAIAHRKSVDVYWTAPRDQDVTSYKVELKDVAVTQQSVELTNVTLAHLNPGTPYTVVVVSMGGTTTGGRGEKRFITKGGEVTDFKANATKTSIAVSWTAPSGVGVIRYHVSLAEVESSTKDTASATEATFDHLTPGTQYTVKVLTMRAIGDVFWAIGSAEKTFSTSLFSIGIGSRRMWKTTTNHL